MATLATTFKELNMENQIITEVPGGTLSTIEQWWLKNTNAIETCYFTSDGRESEVIGVTVVSGPITKALLRKIQAEHLEDALIPSR